MMDVIRKEKVKTAVLVLLLTASIVQIGILWGDQSHRIPFSFILDFFRESSSGNLVNSDVAREELFMPFRVIASDGTEEHWVIKEQDELNGKLWNNAKGVLKAIAGKTPDASYAEPDFWKKIVSKKGFVFEFKEDLNSNLIGWFIGTSGEMPAMRKVMIIPDGDDEKNLEIYICNLENGNTYRTEKYLVARNMWPLDTEAEEKLFSSFTEDKYSVDNYSLFGELNLDKGFALPDVPLAVKSPKYRPYYNITASAPEAVIGIGGENADEELANMVLGNKKDSYNRASFSDSAQFKNPDSIYTIYRNGLLDYKYIRGGDGSNRGDADAALMKAYRFMSNIKDLNNTKAELYLSEIDEREPGKYIFKFDYKFNGIPVYFDMSLDNGSTKIKNAVTIDVDSNRVIRCIWMLRDFYQTNIVNQYNVYFMDIASNEATGEILKNTFITDLNVGYVIAAVKNNGIEPSMVVEDVDSGIYAIKMPKKGD